VRHITRLHRYTNREAPPLICDEAFPYLEHEISLVRVVELIMAKAAAACESRAIRIEPVVAGRKVSRLRNVTLGEHRTGSEREQCESCDEGFHFQSPLCEWKASVHMELADSAIMSGHRT
jgi:hypothetical protein